MRNPKPITDRIFAAILFVCISVMIVSGIAWALGNENGVFVLFVAGAFTTVPMFHFAMHWPSRDQKNPKDPS